MEASPVTVAGTLRDQSSGFARAPRILEVLYSFRVGGSELVGLDLARQLVESGAEVYCAAIDAEPGPLQERCAQYGISVVDLRIATRNPLTRNGLSLALAHRLKDLHLDAVHLQHFLALNKLGLPARLAGIRRVVVTEHSVLDASQSRAGRFRIRLNWRLASTITVVHDGIKEYLCGQLGIPEHRVEVIPIGIETGKYHRHDRQARRTALGIGDEVVFIFVGRLAPVKNIAGLVAAFLAVQSRSRVPSRLLILGTGEEQSAVQMLIDHHPFGRQVVLVGEQADVRSYLAAADVFVLNSRSEGTPRALLEAMAVGLPAICPAVGNIPTMIAGRGWLTDPSDAASLENAMHYVLQNPTAIDEAGSTCTTYVRENFDARRAVDRYRQLLLNRDSVARPENDAT
jgi:glycosyltransferase involved in cell wall biosynthesis